MSVIILGDLFQFPEGAAATNRVYTYAKGFMESNVNVHVICFGNDYVEESQGIADGIHYYYPFGQRERSPSFAVRQWKKFGKLTNTYKLIREINRKDKVDVIISYSNLLSTNAYAFFLAKRFNAKLIAEINEYPMRYFRGSPLKKTQGALKCRLEAAMSDGIVCISPFLVNFYRQKGVKESKLFLLPSTVIASRFQKTGEKPVAQPYIGYFGGLSFERDNVDLLIKAFAEVSDRHPQVRLVVGGIGSDQDREKIRQLIGEFNIGNRVTLLSLLPRQEITKYITHANLLVMVRRKDVLSQASFPSKLSEFLATANPVVAVKVGDVSAFLTDNENAFLVEPEDTKAMADKLDFVLTNYEHAQRVGQKGHELTTSVFSYNYQVKRLMGFIKSLNN